MKKFLCVGLLVLALTGCEQGLTSNDESLTEDEKFSFSKMHSDIKELREEIERLKTTNAALTEALGIVGEDQAGAANSLTARMDDIESTLEGVSRLTDPNTGKTTIRFSGVNVQIVSGSGFTNGVRESWTSNGTVNGLGNLIVGYNEVRDSGNEKSGSHNIIVGARNNYPSYGGFVVGLGNTISGSYSSVSGGSYNIASGDASSVSGGHHNITRKDCSSVSGGSSNTAEDMFSSVSGGLYNTASGVYSSVSGGSYNTASGYSSSVSGGSSNTATGISQHIP